MENITIEQKIELLKLASTLGINTGQDTFNNAEKTVSNFEKLIAAINN